MLRDQGIEDLKWNRRKQMRAAVWGVLAAVDRRVIWPRRPERILERDRRRGIAGSSQPRDVFTQDLYDAIKDMCAALGVTTE